MDASDNMNQIINENDDKFKKNLNSTDDTMKLILE